MTFQGLLTKHGGVRGVLRDLAARAMTGSLGLSRGESPSEKMVIEMVGGNVSHVISQSRPPNLRLGELVLKAGLVDQNQLNEALYITTEKGTMLGTVLSELGFLAERDVGQLLHLQFTEDVFYALTWEDGRFAFKKEAVRARTCPPPFLDTEELLDNHRRFGEDFARAQSLVRNNQMRFKRTRRKRRQTAGIDERDWAMFELVSDDRRVEELVALGRRSTFETCLSLYRLHEAKLIVPVGDGSGGDTRQDRGGGSRVPFFVMSALVGVSLIVTVATVVVVNLGDGTTGVVNDATISPVAKALTRAQITRLRNATNVYRAERGEYPQNLDDLVADGIIAEDDLTYPGWSSPYLYRKDGQEVILVRPKR